MGKLNRYTRQELNSMLFQQLLPIKTKISGGIYIDNERPNNSRVEDIVINTPSLTIGAPGTMQKGYSNINIYVPQRQSEGPGGAKSVYNPRIEDIKNMVIEQLTDYQCSGYLDIESENEGEAESYEQFVNLRLYWRILKTE